MSSQRDMPSSCHAADTATNPATRLHQHTELLETKGIQGVFIAHGLGPVKSMRGLAFPGWEAACFEDWPTKSGM